MLPKLDYVEDLEDTESVKKLSALCLCHVVENFSRFMNAYSFGKDHLSKYFEFLQRAYSETLLKEILNKRGKLKANEIYIKFLFNRHLKKIKLCCRFDVPTTMMIMNRLKEIGSEITSLQLSRLESFLLADLTSALRNVETLIFRNIRITEVTFKSIGSNCHSLKTFDVSYCRGVNDDCIKLLCFPGSPNQPSSLSKTLQYFCIQGTDVGIDGVVFALTNLRNLLCLEHYELCMAVYSFYCNMKNDVCKVSKLNLEMFTYADSPSYPIEYFKMLTSIIPNLKILDMPYITSQQQIDGLSEYSTLKDVKLCIANSLVSNEVDIIPFLETRGENLEKLCLLNANVPLDGLLQLCPKLGHLELINIKFLTVKDFELLRCSLFCLKRIDLAYNIQNDTYIKSILFFLSCCPCLETLNIVSEIDLINKFMASITSLSCVKSLKNVRLDVAELDTSNLKEFILKAQNLKTLSLNSGAISNIEMLRLVKPNIKIITYNKRFNSDIDLLSDYENSDTDLSDPNSSDTDVSDPSSSDTDFNDSSDTELSDPSSSDTDLSDPSSSETDLSDPSSSDTDFTDTSSSNTDLNDDVSSGTDCSDDVFNV